MEAELGLMLRQAKEWQGRLGNHQKLDESQARILPWSLQGQRGPADT